MTRGTNLPSVVQVAASVVLGLASVFILGFFVFFGVVAAQKPEEPQAVSDLAVVLTGSTGRVEAGFELIARGQAKALFITGVHPDVTLKKLVGLWQTTPENKALVLGHCCITLGYMADSTENNARETAGWIDGRDIKTVRIVTSSYHMPRAWLMFRRAMPHITFTVWPVASGSPLTLAFWRSVLVEYSKTLLTWMA